MSPEEEKEFEEMALMEEFEAQEMVAQEEAPQVNSAIEAAGLGAVEGVAFSKDVIAAGKAGYELAPGSFVEGALQAGPIGAALNVAADIYNNPDKSLEDFSEAYSREKSELDAQINEAERKYPKSFFAGDLAGSIYSSIPFGTSLAAGTLMGVGSGISRVEDRSDLTGVMVGGMLGGAFAAGGQKLGEMVLAPVFNKAGEKIAEKTSKIADTRVFKYFAELSDKSWAGFKNAAETFYDVGVEGKTLKKAMHEVGQDIGNLQIMSAGDTIEDVAYKAAQKNSALIGERNSVLSTLDNYVGKPVDDVSIQASKDSAIDTFRVLSRDLYEASVNTDLPVEVMGQAQKAISTLERNFVRTTKDGVEEGIPKTLTQLDELRRYYNEVAEKAFKNESLPPESAAYYKHIKNFAVRLKDHIDDASEEMISKVDDPALDKVLRGRDFKQIKKEIFLSDQIKKSTDAYLKKRPEGLSSHIREWVNFRRATFALGIGGAVFANPAVGLGLAAVEAVSSSQRATPTVAAGLKNLTQYLQTEPGKALARRLGRSVSLATMQNAFGDDTYAADQYLSDEISSAMAQAQLGTKPLDRTNESLIDNANAISALLRSQDKNLADAFNNAMETQDDMELEKIGAMLSQMPEAQQFIAPGQGWNGKFHTEEEKRAAEDGLDLEQDISYSQKLKLKAKIRATGEIPMKRPEPDPFMQWISNRGEEPKI